MSFSFPSPKSEKYALLIVNTWQLPNALNDTLVQLMTLFNWGYSPSNIYLLIDSDKNARVRFLRDFVFKNEKLNFVFNNGSNFVEKYNNLLKIIAVRAHSTTSLYISISGHGGRVKDLNRDEKDGIDECIYPAGRKVLDDALFEGLRNLGSNFTVLCLTDTCHSGTMFDLDRPEKLKCQAYSISACADSEVDWEIGCDLTAVKNFLNLNQNNMTRSGYLGYLSYLPRIFATGSLTSYFVSRAFNGLTGDSISKISQDLSRLGQKVLFSVNTRAGADESDSVASPNSPYGWVIALVIAVVLIVLIIIVCVYLAKHYRSVRTVSAVSV